LIQFGEKDPGRASSRLRKEKASHGSHDITQSPQLRFLRATEPALSEAEGCPLWL
jgi:hypothetical protein